MERSGFVEEAIPPHVAFGDGGAWNEVTWVDPSVGETSYGLGLMVVDLDGEVIAGHLGMDETSGAISVLLTNASEPRGHPKVGEWVIRVGER